MSKADLRTVACNRCLRPTNHRVLWEESRRWEDELDDRFSVEGEDTYTVVECAGCDDVRLLHKHWHSEDMDPDGRPIVKTDYFPPTVTRQKPIWRRNLLHINWKVLTELNPLFDEVYSAHAMGAYSLAVMGIRALTEKIMVEQVGDCGTFAQTIDAFFLAGFVAPVQQPLFKTVLVEAGHAAMHRSFRPSADDVEALLDVIENMVDAIYFQPSRAGAVAKRLPPDTRPKGGRSSS